MKRYKHNLSHHRLASFDMGQLVPVGCVEVLPGDTFRHSTSMLLRVGTLVNPVMHPVSARCHHFFVPARVAYEFRYRDVVATSPLWETFINTEDPTHDQGDLKTQAITNIAAGDLLNHLGLPAINSISMDVNFLPLTAYNMIWNSYYRDQELQTALTPVQTTLQRVCWEKDYFTTCRTYPQYGATTVSIPFSSGQAPVTGLGLLNTVNPNDGNPVDVYETGGGAATGWTGYVKSSDSNAIHMRTDSASAGNLGPEVYADMSGATGGIDVNEFRRSIALQKFLEARSKYGSRYRDYLRYLGVRSRDGRTDEPEYLGGGKQTIAFSEVLATAEGTATEVGDMAGHGIAALRTRPYTRFFEEHGFVLSLVSVRPKAMYQEGMNRHWLRDNRNDFWQKEYEAFGPQAVTNKEVYAAAANETGVFGYQDRFREYREHPSYVSGLFNTTMDDWHYAREFGSTPTLNSAFVSCTPTDRVYADANAPELYAMVNHRIVARRLVAKEAR